MRKTVIAAVAVLAMMSSAQGAGPVPDVAVHTAHSFAPDAAAGTLTVMTYNVHGLPWPGAADRSADLAAIGARLQRLRLAGTAPQVVLLQEAFTADARAIAAQAGYRHVAVGPSRAAPAGRTWPDTAQWTRGEGVGTMLDSGLMILSDHPVTAVRRMAFAADACAGFDCLASKGVLLAAITLPDGQVVDVATAHLNSRRASGVSAARADAAWTRQWSAVQRFITAQRNPAIPLIIAGDFNVGRSAVRRAALRQALSGQHHAAALSSALTLLAHAPTGWSADLNQVMARGKDWTLSADGGGAGDARHAVPMSAAATFGRQTDGTMLSDHIGYTVTYRLDHAGHQL